MATATEDICGFRLAFAIRAAIFAVFLRAAAATRMGTLLFGFHTLQFAFHLPELLAVPNLQAGAAMLGPTTASPLE